MQGSVHGLNLQWVHGLLLFFALAITQQPVLAKDWLLPADSATASAAAPETDPGTVTGPETDSRKELEQKTPQEAQELSSYRPRLEVIPSYLPA